jgi:putative endonuclease
MTHARQALGKRGEDLACAELERRGHTIVERRFRTAHGELDIISSHNGFTVFVEVRAKTTATFGGGAESVTAQKQSRLLLMALDYLARHRLENTPCRFDVVAVAAAVEPPTVTVFEDAFRPGW